MTPEEKERVEELAKRDREVREHEQAHMAAAGPYARGVPTYHYVTGPDHRQYAVSGEVRLEISPISGNPDATIRKMEQIRRAAMAPGDPSGQDQKVAAEAAAQEAKAIKDKTSRTTGQPSAQRNAVLREDPAPENTGAPSVNMLA